MKIIETYTKIPKLVLEMTMEEHDALLDKIKSVYNASHKDHTKITDVYFQSRNENDENSISNGCSFEVKIKEEGAPF